jgi:hypothetical protein
MLRFEPSALTQLADLPSSGDTSYAGVVVGEEDNLLSYYSSDAALDPPWLLGHVLPTRVRIARIPRRVLLGLRDRPLVD